MWPLREALAEHADDEAQLALPILPDGRVVAIVAKSPDEVPLGPRLCCHEKDLPPERASGDDIEPGVAKDRTRRRVLAQDVRYGGVDPLFVFYAKVFGSLEP